MVCPGGGYWGLADHEGDPIAQGLAAEGFDAAVLHYRLAPTHRHPQMLHDAQRGMRLMRQHAAIRAKKTAVLGFSAGGHLASTLAVYGGQFGCEQDDLAAEVEARPDAAVLCYPVIDLAGESAHVGSRTALLGPEADPEEVACLSNHNHVNENTPPTFLWHTADDDVVPLENSLMFARACRQAQVPVELHVYESGEHGLGLACDRSDVRQWFAACVAFLGRHLDDAS